jgi:hypothetical protein
MYGVNYMETFSSAAKMPSLHVILAMATQLDWEIHQVDVKSAYLNAKLNEEVYMIPPQGVLKPGQEGMVCKLKKALYGLKQAGREWYKTLKEVFYKMGYSRSNVNHSVFYIHSEKAHVIVAVDDMAVAGTPLSAIEDFKRGLLSHFDISDMGKIHWFLNFEIKWDRAA